MKNALLLGDYKGGTWHLLHGVDEEIKRILDGFCVTVCEEYPGLSLEELEQYDLVINYIDAWGKRGNADLAGNLLAYVAKGGSMLALHNGGVIAKSSPDLEQMVGAEFVGHPKQEVLDYVVAQAHPITKQLEPFSIDEEPYQFTMANLSGLTMLMEYIYKGEKYPAAWLRSYGKGKVCYLSMGHSALSFQVEGFEKLLLKSALWCANQL